MAIDDKEKRVAVLGVARPWMRDTFPIATPDEEWRASSGNAYGGNSFIVIAVSNVAINIVRVIRKNIAFAITNTDENRDF